MQNAPINVSYVFLSYQPCRDSGKVAASLVRVALEHQSDGNTSYKLDAHKTVASKQL